MGPVSPSYSRVVERIAAVNGSSPVSTNHAVTQNEY